MTDSNKNIIAASTYHPFGETEVKEGSEPYLYNGKEKDTTNLYYYGARYYDPEIGRFITGNLIKGNSMNSQSLNRYSYCLNNPLKYNDQEGLIEDQLSIDGGGTQEEPEITGDPSYYGFGEITIPTSIGDVTIDLGTEEDWGDWDDKAKENQVKEKFREVKQGRQKYREYQAKENRKIRDRYWVDFSKSSAILDNENDSTSIESRYSGLGLGLLLIGADGSVSAFLQAGAAIAGVTTTVGIAAGVVCIAFASIFIVGGVFTGSLIYSVTAYGVDEGLAKWGGFWGGLLDF